jgi:DNA helicase HerA-like ATPase
MKTVEDFKAAIEAGYTFKGDSLLMGAAMFQGEAVDHLHVTAPLKTFNRHGLIAGATGTGKTKTLQVLAEALSEKGVPVLVMDIKGDLSGVSQPGQTHPKIDERHARIGSPWEAKSYPVEFLTISDEDAVRLRATVSEFGPVLFSKILGLNETQSSIVSLVFKYCDDKGLLLLDLKDFRKTLQYLTGEGKAEIEREYGLISTASMGAIIRSVVEIEEQGADKFFGEHSFDVRDLQRLDDQGRGYINILRVSDIQDRPKMFSTFMLCLLAEIYQTFPERGDPEQPELVLFIDEAHLIFREASSAFMEQLETIVKLIRSKGVGVFFCTQVPTDVPAIILSQLGMKVQHALRAFTAKDREAIKTASENYPLSDFYDTAGEMTALGIGEAFFTALNEKGIPTPLARVLLRAPYSRMDVVTEDERREVIRRSQLYTKYSQAVDRESAYEILGRKIEQAEAVAEKEQKGTPRGSRRSSGGVLGRSGTSVVKDMGRTLVRELTRGLLGILRK